MRQHLSVDAENRTMSWLRRCALLCRSEVWCINANIGVMAVFSAAATATVCKCMQRSASVRVSFSGPYISLGIAQIVKCNLNRYIRIVSIQKFRWTKHSLSSSNASVYPVAKCVHSAFRARRYCWQIAIRSSDNEQCLQKWVEKLQSRHCEESSSFKKKRGNHIDAKSMHSSISQTIPDSRSMPRLCNVH